MQALLYQTGKPQIDALLRGLVGLFEDNFPGRIRSHYLVGSYGEGDATPLSDVDIRIIFKDDFQPREEKRMLWLRDACRLISPVAIDCPPLSEARLLHDEAWLHERLGIRESGQLLFGEEIRHTFPAPTLASFVRNISVVPVRRAAALRGQRLPLTFPLDYPDGAGEFYGYEDGAGPEGAKVASTKSLVNLAGYIASSLVALKAGKMVTSKRVWLQAYRDTVDDAWAPLLQEIYRQCKEAWAYQIPAAAQERRALRDLCRQMVDLENHYLVCYRDYLLDEIETGERRRRRFAVQRLQDVIFPEG